MSCLKSWNRDRKTSCSKRNKSAEWAIEIHSQSRVKARNEHETYEIEEFEWSKIDVKMKRATWKDCSQRERWHWLISLSKGELFHSNERGFFNEMGRGFFIEMRRGFFHWNEEGFFIEMKRVISLKWEGVISLKWGGIISLKWERVISLKWKGLFHWNEGFISFKWGGFYFIPMKGFNDHIQVILLSKLLVFAKECMCQSATYRVRRIRFSGSFTIRE